MKLEWYTVVSKHIDTGRLVESNVLAISKEDALKFERGYFGQPVYRVIRAFRKIQQ